VSYCIQADIELEFGAVNVADWANIDRDGSAVTKAARIAEAILVADDELDEVLRDTWLKITATQADGSGVPKAIVRLARRIAGLWLYEGLGAVNYTRDGTPQHGFWWIRQWVDEYKERIRSGKVDINALRGM